MKSKAGSMLLNFLINGTLYFASVFLVVFVVSGVGGYYFAHYRPPITGPEGDWSGLNILGYLVNAGLFILIWGIPTVMFVRRKAPFWSKLLELSLWFAVSLGIFGFGYWAMLTADYPPLQTPR